MTTPIKAAALLLSIALQAPASAAEPSATLTVSFSGMKTPDGAIMAALYNNEADFKGDAEPYRGLRVTIDGDKMVAVISDLQPGRYAIKVFHDLNNNGRLDTNFFGIPTEPYAASNNPPPRMGPPLWKDAVFDLHPGENTQTINID